MRARGFNPKREVRPSQTGLFCSAPEFHVESFNPKREVRPSQTMYTVTIALRTNGFNPKREVRPSQTNQSRFVDGGACRVSIPNGKSGPLRHCRQISAR